MSRKHISLGLVLVMILTVAAPALAADKIQVASFYVNDQWNTMWGDSVSYCETQSNVEVEHFYYSHAGYTDKVILQATTGDMPDLMLIPPERLAPLVYGGVLEELDPWIKRGIDQRAWLPGAATATVFNGSTYGLPAYVVNYTYAFNKDILANRGINPPALEEWVTWDRVREIAQKAAHDQDGDGTPEVWGFYNHNLFAWMIPLIRQAGGRIYDDNMMATFDTPAMYEAIDWMKSMYEDRLLGGVNADFWQGRTATSRMGSWEIKNVLNAGTNVGVASGMMNKEKNDVAFITSWHMGATAKNKEAAWRFATCLTSREAQNNVYPKLGRIPMRRDVQLPYEGRDLVMGLVSALEHTDSYPYHVEDNFVKAAFDKTMTSIFGGIQAPRPAIQELERTVNAYLKEVL